MNRITLAASTLAAAVGLALAGQAIAAGDQHAGMEKCYGVNAVAKNDCAAGAHSCQGQATQARDPQSFVYVPKGVCEKIQGGTTHA